MDERLQHAFICKAGPGGMRPLRAIGAQVDLERVWPSLYKWNDGVCTTAIMDIVAWWPGSCRSHLLDVTVRCPHAESYVNADRRVGVAAAGGEREKVKRYGQAVHCINHHGDKW